MKKTFIALALVMTVAFMSTNAMAWGWGNGWNGNGMMGNGMMMNPGYNSGVTNQAYQDFLNSTAKLRASIDADRAELAAIMASPTPDSKKVRTLTEQMNKKIATLNEQAAAKNLPQNGMGYGMMGPGMMGNGMMGNGMMGPGMMGNGMMGNGMMGNGYYGCW